MKDKIVMFIAFVFGVFFIQAQNQVDSLKYGPDKGLCDENLSIYTEFYKQKNYVDAYLPWTYLFNNAPKRTKNIYIHGPKIIKGLIKAVANDQRKTDLVDSLIMVYDQRNTYYPGKEAYVLGMKGADMYRYMKNSTEGLQASLLVLQESFKLSGYESSSSVINYYFLATTKLVQAKVLKVEDLINLYSDLLRVISYRKAKLSSELYELSQKKDASSKEKKTIQKHEKELKTLSDVKNNLYKTVGPHATCEKLIDLYTTAFDLYKEDIEWMKRAAKLLYKKECTNTEIFFTISEELYKLDPSPFSAYKMGISAYKRGLFTKALEFVTYAYENETDNMYKSKYVFKLAKIYAKLNNNNKAKEFAEKAANYRKGWGEPYIFIGDLYAKTSRSCGELKTEFLKRVGYWAAIDKYEYAKKIDKSSIEGAEERIKKYSEQMPSKTDVFTEGLLDVPTYQIDCWYSERVSIRVPN
tara:strand:- start:7202 stop:8605 length:1404 start_codon:yes stop_codon:yes gene_type:complete